MLISVPEMRRGWPTLVGSMIGMGAGISMFWPASSYFIKPLQAEFGWSRGQVSLTTSIGVLLTSLAMPLIGVLIDRYGPRAFILAGSILFSLAYLALSAMSGQLIIYIVIVLMIGLTAGPATSPLIFTRPLVDAFAKSRGVALGLAYSGTVIISLIVQPTLQHVISAFGWRAGYRIMAPIGLVCGLVSFALLGGIRRVTAPPRLAEAGLGHTLAEALRDARFWLVGLSMVCLALAAGAFASQFQPLLSDMGIPGAKAALLGVWYLASVVIGRLICGSLLDRIWAAGVGFVCLTAPVIGLLLFVGGARPIWVLVVGTLMAGFSFGAEADMMAFFIARYFGLRAFGAVLGMVGMAVGVAAAIGGAVGGMLFDLRHNYNLNLVLGSGLSAVSAFSLLASGLLSGKVARDLPAAAVETAAGERSNR
jgi:MFS family permease